MSNVMPTFNFSDKGQLDATPEEITQAETFVDRRFKPGTHDLKILSCVPHKQAEKDPNWWIYKATLTVEGVKVVQKPKKDGNGTYDVVVNAADKEVSFINYWPMVPVNGVIKYNAATSKAPLAVYAKFKKFMAALGVVVESTYDSLKAAVMSYFATPNALDNRTVRVEIGYSGPYLQRDGDVFRIHQKDGKLLTEEVFGSQELAEAYGLEKGLTLQFSTEILKFLSPSTAASDAKAAKVTW